MRRSLLDWFERMAESAQHRIDLERAAKYDRLGVVKALTLLAIGARAQTPGGAGSVPAHARPHRQERNLHAHRPGAGLGDRRSHPQSQTMRPFRPFCNCLLLLTLLAGAPASRAQSRGGRAPTVSAREQADLENALSEAGSSPIEYLRAVEKHLEKYPDSPRKPELERAAARAAMEANDDRRIILYGERVLARQPDDLQILERVTRSLLAAESKENAERALKYALHYEDLVRKMQNGGGRSGSIGADWQNQTDRGIGRAMAADARATGILGRLDEALALAQRAFEIWPCADAAREIARC